MSWAVFIFWTTYYFQTQTKTIDAWRTIAHRGVSRDVSDEYALAENTAEAMQRAADFGMPGVELDIQMTQDGIPIVAHDRHSARETIFDGLGGRSDPIDIALGMQAPAKKFKYSRYYKLPYQLCNKAPLKVYGRGGHIIEGIPQKLESLEDMLVHLKDLRKPNFKLFLDLQSPDTLRASAALVKKHGLEQQVLLKFFAKQALDSIKYNYTDPETCAYIAQKEGFDGLQLIPQFNDGEMTIGNGMAYIDVLRTRLSITQYLDCWSHANSISAVHMPMIAASVPGSTPQNIPFISAAVEALE